MNYDDISISIIDVIGKMENGVTLLLSLSVKDTVYEIGYWFDKDGNIRIVPEPRFMNKLGISNIYKYEYIEELIHFIHSKIPNMDKIIEEYLN